MKKNNKKGIWYVKDKQITRQKPSGGGGGGSGGGDGGGGGKDSIELESAHFVKPLKMLYDQCKQLKGLLESNNENPREALDFLTESVTKTIDKIAHIADVSFRPTRNSTGDNDDEEKDSDNESKASDSDKTPGVDNAEKLPDPSKLTSCSRNDITTFVKKLCKTDDCQLKEVDILKSKQKRTLVTHWLCLKKKHKSGTD